MKDRIKNNRLVKIISYIFGILMLVLGLVGLIFPVLPGVLFLILGVLILGEGFFLSRFILNKLPEKAKSKIIRKTPK